MLGVLLNTAVIICNQFFPLPDFLDGFLLGISVSFLMYGAWKISPLRRALQKTGGEAPPAQP